MAQRRRSKKEKDLEEFDYIDRETDLDESGEPAFQRKRSQAELKIRQKQKRNDIIVIAVACILIVSLLGSYYALIYNRSINTSEDDDDKSTGNYTAQLYVISDLSHDWAKSSWHIMNIYGKTNFLLKIENTGEIDDTYRLSHNNKIPNINLRFNKNDIIIKSGKAKVVILNVTNNMNSEFRIPNPIIIQLKSIGEQSIMDSINIDITIDILDTTKIIENGDKVSAYYSGAFENGTLFDFSLSDPENTDPLHISLIKDQVQYGGFESIQYTPVIEGFRRGVIGMVPGETFVIIIPPSLGYPSDHNLGGLTLIFEVRLLSNDRDL